MRIRRTAFVSGRRNIGIQAAIRHFCRKTGKRDLFYRGPFFVYRIILNIVEVRAVVMHMINCQSLARKQKGQLAGYFLKKTNQSR